MGIHWRPSVKCDCNWTDFHDIHGSSTTFCKEISYGISWKSHVRFLQWYYVTDGQVNIMSTSVLLFLLRKERLHLIYNWQWFLHHKLRNTAQSVLSISELQQLKIYTIKFKCVCRWFQNRLLLETQCKFNNATSQVSIIHVIQERYRIVVFFSWIQKSLCSCLPNSSDLFWLFVT